MADAGIDVVKGCSEKSDDSQCSAAMLHSSEHAVSRDKVDTKLSDVPHTFPASEIETKSGGCGSYRPPAWKAPNILCVAVVGDP